MIGYLTRKGTIDVVIAVWMLNKLFDKSSNILKQYPSHMDALAVRFGMELKKHRLCAAVIGGSAELWGVSSEFDVWAQRVRDVLRGEGIWVVDGISCYSNL